MTQADLLTLLRKKVAEFNDERGQGGQSRVAAELGYSSGAISQVLSGKYQGDVSNILAKVEEVYGGQFVDCPGLGLEIPLGKCAEWRRKPFAATNPQRVRMFKACKKCDRR
ncbi:hypothetical protein [Desulfuromonas sp. TF]|uniref:hypothetical protein n=1 Tax=Desulfuromonas sp. TF TaxID=1232410 RepID=UPI00040B2FCA|nr:hypothetical protein [Desulfuromonas sp. TF]